MGKNQLTTKEAQSQGICEKIFKAMNVSPAFQLFHRISTVNYPQTVLSHKSATPNFSTKRIVAQDHNNLSFASNMVHVEYNHSSVNTKPEPLNKFPAKIIATTRYHQQNQDPKGAKSEPENKSPIKIKNMVNYKVQLNEDYNDNTSNDRFTKYIDHVKNKLRTVSSFDNDSDVESAATRR